MTVQDKDHTDRLNSKMYGQFTDQNNQCHDDGVSSQFEELGISRGAKTKKRKMVIQDDDEDQDAFDVESNQASSQKLLPNKKTYLQNFMDV